METIYPHPPHFAEPPPAPHQLQPPERSLQDNKPESGACAQGLRSAGLGRASWMLAGLAPQQDQCHPHKAQRRSEPPPPPQ